MSLSGDAGAKGVVARRAGDAAFVAVPEAACDVDTAQDYDALQTS